MTLNGLKLISYERGDNCLILRVMADSIESAKAAITETMIIKDGVDNQADRFDGYTHLVRVISEDPPGEYELTLMRNASYDAELTELKAALMESDAVAMALYEANMEQDVINAEQDEAILGLYEMIGG